jgi:hypothetical protein
MGMTDQKRWQDYLLHGAMLCTLALATVPRMQAQQQLEQSGPGTLEIANATLPDAPAPVSSSAADSSAEGGDEGQASTAAQANGAPDHGGYVQGKQTKRILGVVPNFRSVSADEKLPPQTLRDKFKTTMEDNFDYSAFIFVGALAGVAQAENSTPQFHQGAAGYGRYYWHTFADQTDENTWVEFLLPAALHQDSRYYTLEHASFLKQGVYAVSRVLITRDDNGKEGPNYSEIVGAGAASGISDLYYPSSDRTWTKTGQRWLTNVILDGATFAIKEYWPDINDHLFHQQD